MGTSVTGFNRYCKFCFVLSAINHIWVLGSKFPFFSGDFLSLQRDIFYWVSRIDGEQWTFLRLYRMNIYLFICLFAISWADPSAYGGSQARGLIRTAATGPCQSHSNAGSQPRLQPTPQLTATPDCQPTEQGQGPNPQPHGS